MRAHLINAAYGAIDYLAYPLCLLLLAPHILHLLGKEGYGIWAMACATLNIGAILASGFGDANTRSVAIALGNGREQDLIESIRSSLCVHLSLGALCAGAGWMIAPAIARMAVASAAQLYGDCVWSLRFAALVIGIRAIETVCTSTQRAYGRYSAAIQFSAVARILSIAAAALLPSATHSVCAIMLVTFVINVISLWLQYRSLHGLIGAIPLIPSLSLPGAIKLLKFGGFTWGQSVAGLVFGQVDRVYAAAVFGVAAVTPYVFCVQLAQPIYGIAAAGWHFLFPYIASNHGEEAFSGQIRRTVLMATGLNALFIGVALFISIRFGDLLLRVWAGAEVAASAGKLLPVIAWGTALPAFAITGLYALLAIGKPKAVVASTISGGALMLIALPLLSQRFGLLGIAASRIAYGVMTLVVFLPLARTLANEKRTKSTLSPIIRVCEEA